MITPRHPSLRWALLVLAPALVSGAVPGAVFTVSTTADSGAGSLRQAILDANAAAGTDTIRFAIGSGARTIQPLSPLPTVTDPVTIDGTTQPGFVSNPIIELDGSQAGPGASGLRISAGSSTVTGLVINRFVAAFPATGGHGILLETGGGNVIRGNFIGTNLGASAALPNGGDGVQVSGSSGNLIGRTDGTSRVNVLSGNSTYGVRITGPGANGNTVAGNRIGTNAAGTAAVGNSVSGVAVTSGTDNVVGSALVGDTLISGNDGDGVVISGTATGTVVTGCTIGLNLAGTAALPNAGQGVDIAGTSGNTVGPGNVVSGNTQSGILIIGGGEGNTVAANLVGLNAAGTAAVGNLLNGIIVSGSNGNTVGPGNVVSGNGTNGVRLRSGAGANQVRGNLIGVNPGVTAAIPNGEGVQINDGATDNVVGLPGPDRNVISGNLANGVLIVDATTSGNVVQSNFIGSNATASAPIPNGTRGVMVQAAGGNTIGGVSAGTKNVISFNGSGGVFVESGEGNAVVGNTISFNGGLGIDLAPAGVTPNDAGDPDPGANRLQNFPELTTVLLDAGSTQIQGSLDSIASASYRIEFFASILCDASGHGQGQRFLGAADRSTDPGGHVAFVATLPTAATGPWITATATDAVSNTSEFAACIAVPGPAVTTITPTSGPAGGGTPVSVGGTNFQSGAAVRIGGVAATGVSVVSSAQADALTPALAPGTLNDVSVVNPSSLAGSLPAGFLADFLDVPQDDLFHDDIEAVFRAGITAGCGGGSFCRDASVTRAQMAVFLLKAEHGASYLPPACTGVFDDVPCPSVFADWIEQLAAEGITAGCGGDAYCPDQPVRRDQMAAFLLRTAEGTGYTPPSCTGVFEDVPCPGLFADWIEQLYAAQITGGCSASPLLYCPGSGNTRAQMATFLVKTFVAVAFSRSGSAPFGRTGPRLASLDRGPDPSLVPAPAARASSLASLGRLLAP